MSDFKPPAVPETPIVEGEYLPPRSPRGYDWLHWTQSVTLGDVDMTDIRKQVEALGQNFDELDELLRERDH